MEIANGRPDGIELETQESTTSIGSGKLKLDQNWLDPAQTKRWRGTNKLYKRYKIATPAQIGVLVYRWQHYIYIT
jgi:hypothetical protein